MTQLHQIQLAYVPVEDRALLRISTTDQSEFRFWITRRYAKLLWPALTRSLLQSTHVATQTEPDAKSAVLAFQHEAAMADSDFKTQFQAEKLQTPLGVEPTVLARIQCLRQDDNQTLLAMHPLQGQGIELQLNDLLLHSLVKLLKDAVQAGQWELELELAPQPAEDLQRTQSRSRH